MRLFTFSIYYHGYYLWAKVIEHHDSPSTFNISLQNHWDIDIPNNIILETVDNEIVLSENSPPVNDEILNLLKTKIKEHSTASSPR